MRIIIYSFLLILFTSCLNSDKDINENMKCDSFIYIDPITINSTQPIDTIAWLYRFEPKSGFKNVLDSTQVKVANRDKSKPEEFVMWDRNFQLDTRFDYKIRLNQAIIYTIEDITSTDSHHNTNIAIFAIYGEIGLAPYITFEYVKERRYTS